MKLIAKSGHLGRGLFLGMMVLVLLLAAGCVGQGEKSDSDVELPKDTVLTLNWSKLSGDMENTIIYTRLQAVADGYKIGPYEAFVRESGSARVGINEAYDPSEEWIISYWIDVNNNQICEEDSVDILRQHDLPLGATSATMDHTTDAAPAGLADGALYGFSNYEPQS